MAYKNKQKEKNYHKQYFKKYYKKNKSTIKCKHDRYYTENEAIISDKHKKWRREHPNYQIEWRKKHIDSWKSIIPTKTNCALCNKVIRFNTRKKTGSIHFDHRNGGKERIKVSPSSWLNNNFRTSKKEAIWLSCNFGTLCENCNGALPTKNRKDWVIKLVGYTFGEKVMNKTRRN